MGFIAPVAAAAGPFCLEAFPEEDLVVLVAQSSDASRGRAAPEWLKRALRSSGFLSLSRTSDRRLSVVIGQSFLKEVTLPDDVEVQRDWAALRLNKASLDPAAALHSFSSLCRTVQEAGLALHALSTPTSEDLLLQAHQLPLMAAALLKAGHAVAPSSRICATPPSSLVRKNDQCRAYAGAWGLARREAPLGVPVEEHAHGRGPLRLIASCGLFVDIRFSRSADELQASCCGCFEALASARVKRHKLVDFQPPLGVVPEIELAVEGAILHESGLPSGSYRETWQRLEARSTTVALELVSETPSKSVKRQGCWVFCGSLFARVVGLARGQGVVAGTCCSSLEQLQQLKGSEAIRSEIDSHYEALCGTLEKPGVLRVTQNASSTESAGALFYSADEGVGGTISLPSKKATEVVHVLPDGTEQRWKVLEWGFNPFSERSLSPPASEGSASCSISAKRKKKKKKEKTRSVSRSGSDSDSGVRKKKKKKEKEKEKEKGKKKKKKDKDKANSSDDAKRSSASSEEAQTKKKKDKDKEKDKDRKRSASRSVDKKKKKKKEKDDRSRSGSRSGKKKKKEKKDRSRSRSRSRSGKKKKRDASSSSMSMSPKKKELDKKKEDNDGHAIMGKAAEANAAAEAEPKKTPITFNFAPKSALQRDVSDRAVAQKMLQKSEAHAGHLATVGALLKKAAQAKAQDDPEPAPPPELLAGPLARTQAIAPAANVAANSGEAGIGIQHQEVGKQRSESVAKAELQVAIREEASKEGAIEDTTKAELPANFQFPKGYPPPKDEADAHDFPANFQFPKGYPPPPEDSAASAHPLFPRGYPPPPEIDPATALLQSGINLSLPPPPPPPDLNAATAQLLMAPGMLFPQPADLAGAFVLPPPPGPPPATAPGADSVNDFITEYKIDPRAAGALRALPLELQQKVVAEGEIKGTNPSAVITSRIRKFQAQAEAQAVKLAASLPPGAIGPQPPPGVAVGVLGPPPGPPPGAPPPPPLLAAEAAAVAHLQAAQAAQAAQVAQLAALQPGLLASLSGLGAALSANPALQAAAGLLLQAPPGPPPAP